MQNDIASRFLNCRGQFLAVEYISTSAKPAAAFKGVTLGKTVRTVARAGVDYANLAKVKEAVANGERGEVQPLPWGEWSRFPYTIAHKGKEYVRLYPVPNAHTEVVYTVNGERVTRETWAGYLTPAARASMNSGETPECITVAAENVRFPEPIE